MLHGLNAIFDEEIQNHDVYKIETTGVTYTIISGKSLSPVCMVISAWCLQCLSEIYWWDIHTWIFFPKVFLTEMARSMAVKLHTWPCNFKVKSTTWKCHTCQAPKSSWGWEFIQVCPNHLLPDILNFFALVWLSAGLVVAGAIGSRMPQFSLFGELVPTAAMIERTGRGREMLQMTSRWYSWTCWCCHFLLQGDGFM